MMRLIRISMLLTLATCGAARAQAVTGSSLAIAGTVSNTFANDGGAPRLSLFPVTPTTGDAFTSPDSLQLGGSAEWAGGQMTIRGMPYGYFDTGALLSLTATDRSLTNLRPGINGGYNKGPAAMAADPDMDMISLYNHTGSVLPRIVASAAVKNADNIARAITYTATTINFSPALAPAQMALLRRSMWVITNSIDLRMVASSFTMAAASLAAIASGDAMTVSSTGPLPAGLTAGQTYYAMVAYGRLYLASSAANAVNGVPVPITGPGSGSITIQDVTKSASAAASVGLYVAPTTTLPTVDYYASTITGWSADGSSITVAGWTVPGAGNGASGQIPPTAPGNLDTINSSYTSPAVFIGSPTKAFLNNWIQAYEPDPSSNYGINGGASYAAPYSHDSQIHQFEGLELDQWNYGTVDYAASFHGMTIGYTPFGVVGADTSTGHNVLPTSDSYDLLLAGSMPTMLKFDEGPASSVIQGHSLLVNGNVSPAAAINSRSELMESSKLIDQNNMRLVTWLQRDTTGVGVTTASLRTGLMVDGTQGNLDGSLQGQMVFSPPGYGGGIGFCGYSGRCGLYIQADGNLSLGNGSAFILRTPSGAIGGTITGDAQGDTVIGTQVAYGSLIASNPLVAQSGLNVTGGVATIANGLTANAIYSKNQIQVGKNAALWFQTSAGTIAGTVSSDDAGDVLMGTQVGGGAAISAMPFKAQNGLSVTGGNATITNSLTASALYSNGQVVVGKGSGLLFQTSTGATAGTVSSDNAGDVNLGTQVAGGAVIASTPVTAQQGIIVTGGTLKSTVPVQFPSYAYAALPAAGIAGRLVLCSDCLKPAQAAGNGTGMMVFDDGHANWVSVAGTVAAH